jgi:hypothetical protein
MLGTRRPAARMRRSRCDGDVRVGVRGQFLCPGTRDPAIARSQVAEPIPRLGPERVCHPGRCGGGSSRPTRSPSVSSRPRYRATRPAVPEHHRRGTAAATYVKSHPMRLPYPPAELTALRCSPAAAQFAIPGAISPQQGPQVPRTSRAWGDTAEPHPRQVTPSSLASPATRAARR